MNTTIRFGTLEDFPDILQLYKEEFGVEAGNTNPALLRYAHENRQLLIAEVEDKVVGFVSYLSIKQLNTVETALHMTDIFHLTYEELVDIALDAIDENDLYYDFFDMNFGIHYSDSEEIIFEDIDYDDFDIYVTDFIVNPEYRRRGIGTMLSYQLGMMAIASGAKTIFAECTDASYGISKRYGFEDIFVFKDKLCPGNNIYCVKLLTSNLP